MIKLEFNGEQYKLPTTFKEITLDKYMSISKLPKDLNPTDRLIEILSILTDLRTEEIRSIDLDQVNILASGIKFLFSHSDFKTVPEIEIDGIIYGFDDLSNMNFAQFIDLEEFSKPENANDNLHLIMANIYRPVIGKRIKGKTNLLSLIKKYIKLEKLEYENEIEAYTDKGYKERAEIFKRKMTVDIALGAMFFFTILKLTYIEAMNGSKKMNQKELEQRVMKRLEALGIDTMINGGG